MSKRTADGDVLANRLALGEAKGRRFLASLLGPAPPEAESNAAKLHDANDDDDLKQTYGHDRLGVGAILPKDIADGSFTKRAPTSNDKLLAQLIGKKKAKAHIAAKQEAARPGAKTQNYGKPTVQKKEVSEDEEEEGRTGAFGSKRSKKLKSNPKITSDSDNEDEEMRAARLMKSEVEEEAAMTPADDADIPEKTEQSLVAIDDETEEIKTTPKKAKIKPKSFLDEILAERTKKRKKNKG
ncbi:hypothetical protein ACN47E_005290 [Coniothyrium glycines]